MDNRSLSRKQETDIVCLAFETLECRVKACDSSRESSGRAFNGGYYTRTDWAYEVAGCLPKNRYRAMAILRAHREQNYKTDHPKTINVLCARYYNMLRVKGLFKHGSRFLTEAG